MMQCPIPAELIVLAGVPSEDQIFPAPLSMLSMVAAWVEGVELPPEDQSMLCAWIEERRRFHDEAKQVIADFEAKFPTPTASQLGFGEAGFPPHHDQPWWILLNHAPWAHGYEEALARAKYELAEMIVPYREPS